MEVNGARDTGAEGAVAGAEEADGSGFVREGAKGSAGEAAPSQISGIPEPTQYLHQDRRGEIFQPHRRRTEPSEETTPTFSFKKEPWKIATPLPSSSCNYNNSQGPF